MATARVVLRGRFSPGTIVKLIKVRDESVLRAEGGEQIGREKKVGDDGSVEFTSGVEKGARYLIVGYDGGHPREVRATGRTDEAGEGWQPAVRPDRQRLTDGTWLDEHPEKESTPGMEVGPLPRQSQVPKDQPQRSDTPRGEAHPHDPSEQAPYGRQEDVKDSVVQMSSTDTGKATPLVLGSQRQEDVPAGTWQRSDTPKGVATPIPAGDAVKAAKEKESAAAKERRGEPVQAAASPLAEAGASGLPAKKTVGDAHPGLSQPGMGDTRGVDAQGQPAYPDVAKSTGVEPASKPGSEKEQTSRPARAKRQSAKTAASPRTKTKASPPEGGKAADQSTTAKEK